MKNVFLATCDSPNFDETVRKAVDLTELSEYPSQLDDEQEVRFWGARIGSRNKNNFKKMQNGDLILFYQDGNYIATARVNFKFRDEAGWASSNFWRGGESYLLYTLTDFEEVSVARQKVNTIFGYSQDYYPQGLMRVNPDNINKRTASIKLALKQIS